MTLSLDELPNDVASLKALLLAAHADNARLAARNERLDHIIKVLRRARFGRSSERIDDDQWKGTISVGARIRAILEDADGLPQAVKDTIEKAVGEGKGPLDALIMVGLLQGLQGDQMWAKLLLEHGWGKPEQVSKIGNLPGENFRTEAEVKIPQAQIDAAVLKSIGFVTAEAEEPYGGPGDSSS